MDYRALFSIKGVIQYSVFVKTAIESYSVKKNGKQQFCYKIQNSLNNTLLTKPIGLAYLAMTPNMTHRVMCNYRGQLNQCNNGGNHLREVLILKNTLILHILKQIYYVSKLNALSYLVLFLFPSLIGKFNSKICFQFFLPFNTFCTIGQVKIQQKSNYLS